MATAQHMGELQGQIRVLFRRLSPDAQKQLLEDLISAPPPIPTPKGGVVLSCVARAMNSRLYWTVPDIKAAIQEEGVEAKPKELYNALGYLARRGYVKKVGYGRYLVEGGMAETIEDIGLEPLRHED